jgi:KaiC/GvpD/RAD55 family RecA-like ATPase/predicted RNA-binding Zn-ribbon protein involved in translation (DUF1610 family)
MIQALGIEIAEVKKKGSGTQIALTGGERVGVAEGHYLYRFPVSDELHLRDETPVRVVCGQDQVDGQVVSLRESWLTVALEKDLGPRIPTAQLITNDSFLLERLKDKLEDIQKGAASGNHAFAGQVIGEVAVKSADAEPDEAVWLGLLALNQEQRQAVRRALGSTATFIWGPPGTGKTTTLARVVEAFYRAGHSVLLVSNTNIAVDTALLHVAKRLEGEVAFQQGAVVRYGPVVSGEELDQRYGDQVVVERIVERLSRDLLEQKRAIERQLHAVQQEAQPVRAAIHAYEEVERLRQQIADHEHSLIATQQRLAAAQHRRDGHAARLASLQNDLARARAAGSLRRLFTGLNPERISRELGREETAKRATEDTLSPLTTSIRQVEHQLADVRVRLHEAEKQVQGQPPAGECRARLGSFEEREKQLQQHLKELEAQLSAVRDEVLKNCRVLATTVYRTYLRKQVERPFDVVIIDEASMLMPPMAYYAAGLARQAVVVAGDFRQLPPIVMARDPLTEEWLKKDVFEKSGIVGAVARRQRPAHLVPLQEQYRMHESICSLINDFFYHDNPLRTHESVKQRHLAPNPLVMKPLAYVDTSLLNPWASLRLGTWSRYNLLHALLVRNIAVHLAEAGYLDTDAGEVRRLGIVSPYGAQVRLLSALLEGKLTQSARHGNTATVHRFQGNERDSMVVEITDSIGCRPSQFVKAADISEDGARLLNVALSRPRGHIILVANFTYLLEKLPDKAILRGVLRRFQGEGQPLDADSVLSLGDADWVDGLRQLNPRGFPISEGLTGIFSEGTFFPTFMADLEAAQRSAVIFSPFLTARGAGRLADHLRAAIGRGVAVRLVTNPPAPSGLFGDDGLVETMEALRKLGVAVDLRAKMHEKIAFLDDSVVWAGSLNIMSHRDTSELMLRLPSRAAFEQIAAFVTTPGMGKSEERALFEQENPTHSCGCPMVWNTGPYGVYFACPQCGEKVDARRLRHGDSASPRNKRRTDQRRAAPVKPCPEPGCRGRLTRRAGRRGPFLGCSEYPRCRHTEEMD